jgi:chemotaxis signal transduction protein
LRLSNIVETMTPQRIEALAGPLPFILGVSIVRSAALSVVNLGAVVGTSTRRSPSRFVGELGRGAKEG